jgi:hypothetical protein
VSKSPTNQQNFFEIDNPSALIQRLKNNEERLATFTIGKSPQNVNFGNQN